MTCYDCIELLDCDFYTQCGKINTGKIPHRTPCTDVEKNPCEYFHSSKKEPWAIGKHEKSELK